MWFHPQRIGQAEEEARDEQIVHDEVEDPRQGAVERVAHDDVGTGQKHHDDNAQGRDAGQDKI